MEIYRSQVAQSAQTASSLNNVNARRQASNTNESTGTLVKDEVKFSEAAQKMSDFTQTSDSSSEVRFELVNRIRSEIAAGTYDTPEKFEKAFDQMLAQIG